jgi:hypothetical protein
MLGDGVAACIADTLSLLDTYFHVDIFQNRRAGPPF